MENKEELQQKEKFLVGPNDEKIEIKLITPELAEYLLMLNKNNRRVKETSVKKYVRDMNNGAWLFNGSPILISKEKELLNGQHRLLSILESRKSQFLIVISNVDKSVLKTVDCGDARTNSDVVKMFGIDDAKLKTSVSKKVLSQILDLPTKRVSFSAEETLEELTNSSRTEYYEKMIDYSKNIVNHYKMLPRTTICMTYIMLHHLGYEESKINDFFEQLADLKDSCMTIINLKQRLKPVGDKSLTVEEKEKILIKSCNQFFKGNFNYCVYNVRSNSSLKVKFE